MSLDGLVAAIEGGTSALVRADADAVFERTQPLAGSARLVLIDPPYNRRTRFHHYVDSITRDEWVDERQRHADALHSLLTDDGSLWMHIDDREMPRARHLLDNTFGHDNFVATIVWQKSTSRDNRTPISTTHEYILVYAKDRSTFHGFRAKLPPTEEQLKRYKNPDNDPRGPWTSGDMTAKAGPGRRRAQFYTVTLPSGREVNPTEGTAWRFTREVLDKKIADKRVYFGKGNSMPRLKRFLAEVEPGLVPDTCWSGDQVGTAATAKRHLKRLFPNSEKPFETPKPEQLTERILHIASRPGDLVVDCYAGSGTTAAVAQRLGRRWLAIERESETFSEFTHPRLQGTFGDAGFLVFEDPL